MVIDLRTIVTEADNAVALDAYKISYDRYTDIGYAVSELKYELLPNSLYDEASNYIFYLVKELHILCEELGGFDLILPAPSYRTNYDSIKLMYLLVPELARSLSLPYELDILKKLTRKQAKSSNLSISDYSAEYLPIQFQSAHVLIVDDLFGSGKTANFIIKLLKQKNPDIKITFVSLTKNILGGIPRQYECYIVPEQQLKLLGNGNEMIKLYFYDENKNKQVVNIFSNNNSFDTVKNLFECNQLNTSVTLNLSKNQKDFWTVRD